MTYWQLLTSNYMLKAAVAVASHNALKCYRQRLEHQSRKSLFGLSSPLWCCIVVFPLLVSYFDYCTSLCSALHATQKQMNQYILNVISASSATYRHQAKCRAYEHIKITFHILHFTIRAILFSFLASKQVD